MTPRRNQPRSLPLIASTCALGMATTLTLGACSLGTIVAPEEAMDSAPAAAHARQEATASPEGAVEQGQETAEVPQAATNGAPGGSSEVKWMRGTACVGSASPLIIVGGKRSEAGFDEIAALDIESFKIVKGSDAVEIYGEDGRNGAIVIFTKQSGGDGEVPGPPGEPPN